MNNNLNFSDIIYERINYKSKDNIMVKKATFFTGEPCRISLEFLISDIEQEIEDQNFRAVESKIRYLAEQMECYKRKASEAVQILEEKRQMFKSLSRRLKYSTEDDCQLEIDIAKAESDIEFFTRSLNEECPAVSIDSLSERVDQLKAKVQLAKNEDVVC